MVTAELGLGVSAAVRFALTFQAIAEDRYIGARGNEVEHDPDIQAFMGVLQNTGFQTQIAPMNDCQCLTVSVG